MRVRRWLGIPVAAAGVWLALVVTARADTPTAPSPEAVAAFDEGRRLMNAHDYAGAIAKFEQSIRATRTVGALLNLGRAYEETHRAASAWATYRAAAALARELHDRREGDGEKFAAAMLPQVSHLTLGAQALDGVAGAEITCDGVAVVPREPIPLDAGSHTVAVKAPGKRPWTKDVPVPPDGAQVTLELGPLEDAPAPAPPPGAVLPTAPPPPQAPPSNARRTVGYVVGGFGLAGLAAGAATGVLALLRHNDATSGCPTYPVHCPSSGAADGPNHDAQTFATVSTVSFLAGGLALGVGAVIVWTSPGSGPDHPEAAVRVAPTLGPQGGGVRAEVTW